MVNEDWERTRDLDQMYIHELQQEIEQEYKQYSKERLPAIITVKFETKKEEKIHDKL